MTRLYWHLLFGAFTAFGGLGAMLIAARFGMYSDIVTLIVLAGAVGAVVNNYYRLAKLSEAGVPNPDDQSYRLVLVQMYVSMLIAGILAFVVYGLFVSGLVEGALFPRFSRADEKYKDISTMLLSLGPDSNVDAA